MHRSWSESEYEYNPSDLEDDRGRYTDLDDERLHERLESIQRKLIMSGNEDLSSQNSGYITDYSKMNALPGVGIVEESK